MESLMASGWLLLGLLTVSECGSERVLGYAGQNVTLACKYNIKYHGTVAICWGRGDIPNSGCHDEIIASDGSNVITRKSDRFQLLGALDSGDVSLTILNVTEADSGRYGCRVHVYGWFNDLKYHTDLTVTKAPEPITPRTLDHVTTMEQTTSNHTQGHMNSTEDWGTSDPWSRQSEGMQNNSLLPVVLVCVLLALLLLAAGGGVVFLTRRWRRLKTLDSPRWSGSSMRYRTSQSGLGLHNRESVVENIYQLDGIEDFEDYP